jgi:tRNA(Arg) A34 adenosine deaminase TadA
MAANFEIVCPCCESTIIVDRISGEVLLHKVKETKASGSLDSMLSKLQAEKSEVEKRFERQLESQKDRARILEEKFKEAMQRADKDDKYVNPMDMD